jgi:hypothetical protein
MLNEGESFFQEARPTAVERLEIARLKDVILNGRRP